MLAVSRIKRHVIELETTALYQQNTYMFVYRSFLNITFLIIMFFFRNVLSEVSLSITSAGDVGGISGVSIIS